MAKIIFTGLEDSGKSYKLAVTAGELIERNAKWLKMGCKPRPIVTNLEFMPWFNEYAESLGIPIRTWRDLEELPDMKNCDLFIDEVGTYFDSRTFKDLSLDVRLWLAQASKLGVDMYGSAQDFAQVDISFRRLVTGLYEITKLAGSQRPAETRPPVKRIWGVCTMKQMDPVGYDEQKKAFNNISVIPSVFFIRKQYCEIFDTTKRIAKSKPVPYKHIIRPCADPSCSFKLYEKVGGITHKVTHV